MSSSVLHSSDAADTKFLRPVLDGIWAFSPNRDTMGGTAYLIQRTTGNVLVDCPAVDDAGEQRLHALGGIRYLIVTHRGAIAQVNDLQTRFGCEVIIQEQEAYLLPGIAVTSFHSQHCVDSDLEVIWTPGHTPGSSCVYLNQQGGVLLTGRHLLPDRQGQPTPLRISKTFHWGRQLRSVQRLRDRFSSDTLQYLCPGANLGFLRGKRVIDQAYAAIAQLDLDALQQIQPWL